MKKLILVILFALVATTAFAFGHRVVRFTDENGQGHVIRIYDNGQTVIE